MNNTDFQRNRSSLHLLGKEFIIVIVVIFSALSFTLGYFVGKSGMDGKPENLPQAADITPVSPKQEPVMPSAEKVLAAAENALSAKESAEVQGLSQKKEPPIVFEEKQTVPAKGPQPVKGQGQAVAGLTPKENSEKPPVKSSAVADHSAVSTVPEEPLYTVQMAAFKSSSEVLTFRKKYASKGIKTFVTTATDSKREKIYKVKTGEFKDRKGAEMLSLKLNKTEKLKTFVTVKSE